MLLYGFPIYTYSQFVVLEDSSMYFLKDTALIPFHIVDSGFYSYEDYNSVIPQIEKSLKLYWQNEFMKMITAGEPAKEEINSNNFYEKYTGKIIRNIDIKQLEVFGQTISDTTHGPAKWSESIGNKLHINTRQQMLKEKFLVQSGDSLNPFVLADDERLMRALPYIKNVQLIVTEIGNDSVDLLYLTKDVFSLGFGLEIFDISYGQTGIWNKNLFGIGHELYYQLMWDYSKPQKFGHKARYRIQNIGNSFVTADVTYENKWKLIAYKLYLNRNFLTPEMKYAGGSGFEIIKSIRDIVLPDTIIPNNKVDYNYFDLWLGRSILLFHSYEKKKRTNIAITGRIMSYNFSNRPENVSSDFLHAYHNRTLLLGSIGLSNQAYQKTNLVYGFGKSEDIPYGFLVTFTAGLEENEFFDRPYLGFSYSFGALGDRFGFLYYAIEYGTFFNEGIEQSTISLRFKNFSPLINREGRFQYRFFTKINYKTGANRLDDEFIELGDNNYIRGLTSENLRGTQRLNINFESVCYSPHYILGFRFLYFLFIDAGMINYNHELLVQNPVYTGFGAGIKIKNENLVFNTILLRFSYYPLVPEDPDLEYIYLSGAKTPQHESFIVPKPEILKY